jgi:hypothetical protein
MAYYVDRDGVVLQYRLGPCHTLELSNGAIVNDPPPGQMFATEKAAQKYSDLLKELGDVEKAKAAHAEWVRKGAP